MGEEIFKLKVSDVEDLKLVLRIIKKLRKLNLIDSAKLEDIDKNGNIIIKIVY